MTGKKRMLKHPSTDVNFIASQALARSQQQPDGTMNGDGDEDDNERGDAMAALERQARAHQGFVPASTGPHVGNPEPAEPPVATNPDALDIDLDDD